MGCFLHVSVLAVILVTLSQVHLSDSQLLPQLSYSTWNDLQRCSSVSDCTRDGKYWCAGGACTQGVCKEVFKQPGSACKDIYDCNDLDHKYLICVDAVCVVNETEPCHLDEYARAPTCTQKGAYCRTSGEPNAAGFCQ